MRPSSRLVSDAKLPPIWLTLWASSPEVCCSEGAASQGREVRRSIQSNRGEVKQAAWRKRLGYGWDIHRFMLSLWRKQIRERVIVARPSKLDVETTAELRRLKELERRYKVLKEEHELLKKAIRFASGRKRKSSSSSK